MAIQEASQKEFPEPIWRQRALRPTYSKGPLTGKYLASAEEEILLPLEATWSVPWLSHSESHIPPSGALRRV